MASNLINNLLNLKFIGKRKCSFHSRVVRVIIFVPHDIIPVQVKNNQNDDKVEFSTNLEKTWTLFWSAVVYRINKPRIKQIFPDGKI